MSTFKPIKLTQGQIEVELQEVMGSDRHVAEAAWTSSTTYQGKNKKTDEDVARVVNMLADLKHSVPFEGIIFRWWIKLPIQTDRQLMTHRLQSSSGQSGRYRTMPDEVYEMPPEAVESIARALTPLQGMFYEQEYKRLTEQSNKFYRGLLAKMKHAESLGTITNDEYKRIRELFRGVLPQNNMTERVSIMNLRSWANFIKLRSAKDAQAEIQIVANLMLEAVKQSGVCPEALKALEHNNWSI